MNTCLNGLEWHLALPAQRHGTLSSLQMIPKQRRLRVPEEEGTRVATRMLLAQRRSR